MSAENIFSQKTTRSKELCDNMLFRAFLKGTVSRATHAQLNYLNFISVSYLPQVRRVHIGVDIFWINYFSLVRSDPCSYRYVLFGGYSVLLARNAGLTQLNYIREWLHGIAVPVSWAAWISFIRGWVNRTANCVHLVTDSANWRQILTWNFIPTLGYDF